MPKKDIEVLKSNFFNICEEMEKTLESAIDAALDSYTNKSNQKSIISLLANAKKLSEQIETAVKDVDSTQEFFTTLERIDNLFAQRKQIFDKLIKLLGIYQELPELQ